MALLTHMLGTAENASQYIICLDCGEIVGAACIKSPRYH